METKITKAISGMSKDAWSTEEGQYTHALNSVLEGMEGKEYILNNEGSNILATKIKEGFKVIGRGREYSTNDLYLVLTNPDTGDSEIGKVTLTQFNDNEILERDFCNDCGSLSLGDRLEDKVQKPYLEYKTLISDACHTNPDLKFGFNINYPIKNIVFKREGSKLTMYLTDGLGHPRNVEVSNIKKYYLREVNCSDSQTLDCPDLNKTIVFKEAVPPNIKLKRMESGGALPESTYQYFIKYCDKTGESMTEVLDYTVAIRVFDRNNITRDPNEKIITSQAIKLKVDSLDNRYTHYKVIVRQAFPSTVEGGGYTYRSFILGVYPIDRTEILHLNSDNLIEITEAEEIYTGRRYVETTDVVESTNNLLVHTGVKEKSIMNLQPVVNFIGEFVKWRTFTAKDNIYENVESASTKIGYQRDEVQPLAIKFRTKSGYKTTAFPLIGRMPDKKDLEKVQPNKDYESLNSTNLSCSKSTRDEVWKIYNTAKEENINCIEEENDEIEYVEVEDTLERTCITENIDSIKDGQIEVIIEDKYEGFKAFLEDYIIEGEENVCSRLIKGPDAGRFCDIIHTDYPISNSCDTDGLFANIDYTITGTIKSNTISDISTFTEEFIPAKFPVEYSQSTVPRKITPLQKGIKAEDRVMEPLAVQGRLGPLHTQAYKGRNDPYTRWKEIPSVFERANEDHYTQCSAAGDVMKEENVSNENKKVISNNFKYHVRGFDGERTQEQLKKEMWTSKRHKLPENNHTSKDEVMVIFYSSNKDGLENTAEDKGQYRSILRDSMLKVKMSGDGGIFEHSSPVGSTRALKDVAKNLNKTVLAPTGASKYSYYVDEWVGYGTFIGNKPKNFTLECFNEFINGEEEEKGGEVHVGFYGKDDLKGNKVSNNASWLKVVPQIRPEDTEFILDISPQSNTFVNAREDFFNRIYNDRKLGSRIVISIFSGCSQNEAIFSIDTTYNQSHIIKFKKVGDNDLEIEDGTGKKEFIKGGFRATGYYVCVDTFMVKMPLFADGISGYFSYPSMGYYTVTWRNVRNTSVKINFEEIGINQSVTYEALCKFKQPVLNSCNVIPKRLGRFSYWESVELYPDNKYLFDSRGLKIKEELVPEGVKKEFLEKFTIVTPTGDIETNLDLRCKPIRHFKFPDNSVAPITSDVPVQPFGETVIEILGVSIDENVINMALDIAEYNGLITTKERADIIGYEIMRGELTLERSVKSSGIIFDMREYKEGSNTVKYSNYPYNSFSDDIFNNVQGGPNFGNSGTQYTYHSPETDYTGNTSGTEMSIQGVQYGATKGVFEEVKDHPKWVILTDRAFRTANKLAGLEVNLEMVISAAQMLSNGVTGAFAGVTSGAFIPVQAIAASASVAATLLMREPRKERFRLEWLRSYENLGIPINFAYYHHSVGKYTYMDAKERRGNKIRSLNTNKKLDTGAITVNNSITGDRTTVNNRYRERSTFLDVGKYPISYDSRYSNFDKGSNTSLYNLGKSSFREGKNTSVEMTRNIASMYVYLKEYLPAQHSTLNSVNWVTTGFQSDLRVPNTCTQIFGGDTFIVRHSLKRKHAQFDIDYHRQADMTPIDYKFYNNIGNNPKFYVKYKMDTSPTTGAGENSEYTYVLGLDNETKSGKYYVAPSMFYLYYYGVPHFLCESRINTNFRTAGKTMKEQFYPETGDISGWTQQTNVDIQENNTFNYNKALYETPSISIGGEMLSEFFDPTEDKNKAYKQGMVMYSNPDNNLFGATDPWLVYKPNNVYFSNTDWGKLQGVVSIEDEVILGLYDLKSVLFNAVDTTIDTGQNPETKAFGDGRLFSRRVKDFSSSLGGFGGTQGYHSVKTEFGVVYVNNVSGEIYLLSGKKLVPISTVNTSGKATLMSHWFKNHLPFKIFGSNIENANMIDVDNAFNSVGMTLGYDNRYKRLLITKKDYLPKVSGIEYRYKEGFYFNNKKVELTDEKMFQDVGFTISFSFKTGTWTSFHSYKPNYYVTDRETFYTGVNKEGKEKGLWVHNKTNKSFQVFYGKRYPFEIDYMVEKTTGSVMAVNDISFYLSVYKYHNHFNKALVKGMFDKVYVYADEVNSGELRPDFSNGTLDQAFEYPKTSPDKSYQRVLVSQLNDSTYVINGLYNRANRNMYNVLGWVEEPNGYTKNLNYQKVNFLPLNEVLVPFRAKSYSVRMVQEKESRLSYNLDLTLSKFTKVKE